MVLYATESYPGLWGQGESLPSLYFSKNPGCCQENTGDQDGCYYRGLVVADTLERATVMERR